VGPFFKNWLNEFAMYLSQCGVVLRRVSQKAPIQTFTNNKDKQAGYTHKANIH